MKPLMSGRMRPSEQGGEGKMQGGMCKTNSRGETYPQEQEPGYETGHSRRIPQKGDAERKRENARPEPIKRSFLFTAGKELDHDKVTRGRRGSRVMKRINHKSVERGDIGLCTGQVEILG